MNAIDPATGLPLLPEGYRWAVDEEEEYSYYSFRPTGRLVVRIYVSGLQVSTTAGVRWWNRRTRATEIVWTNAPHSTSEVVQGNHPIAVLNAAHKCLNKWNTEKKRVALVGAYPPKKLVTS